MSQAEAKQLRDVLQRGRSLLQEGDVRAAQHCALEALALRPGNPEAKNLMGAAYYAEGAYGLSCDVFDGLARRNGDSVVLRVNAGVAALKAHRTALALTHLRRAVDLDPCHRRAFAYLGLLHLQGGDAPFASAALREAGLERLAQQAHDGGTNADLLIDQLWREVAELRDAEFDEHQGTGERFVEVVESRVQQPADTAAAPSKPSTRRAASHRDATTAAVPVGAEIGCSRSTHQRRRSDVDPRAGCDPRVSLGRETSRIPLVAPAVAVGPDVDVKEERIYVRCGAWRAAGGQSMPFVVREDQVLLTQGTIARRPAFRRSKGRDAVPFDGQAGPMVSLDGEGVAVLESASHTRFVPMDLAVDGQCLCVREDSLAAFSTALHWVNGSLPDGAPMIRLCGQGPAVLAPGGTMGIVPVDPGTPANVRPAALVGWFGDVVVSWERPLATASALFRCEGEGTVLVLER